MELKKLLVEIDSDMEVVAQLETVKASVNWLRENKVDLIFMDIHLGDGNSFSIFDQVELKTPVVFTTAFDEYAVQAFKTYSIDYLLKPIEKEAIEKAVRKYKELYEQPNVNDFLTDKIQDLLSSVKEDEYKTRFMVQMGSRIKTLEEKDIAYFMADGKVQMVISKKGEKFFINQSLHDLEAKLNPKLFFRLNRKFIVRIDSIDEIITLSKSRLKVKLIPEHENELDSVVSSEKSAAFKRWINGED